MFSIHYWLSDIADFLSVIVTIISFIGVKVFEERFPGSLKFVVSFQVV